ncbi:MAG: hypothetical protein H6719_30460 [Sandaracinaceae bacterium]|nr:hypothetical protein [Sandaracinaceae bacterium]
MPYRDDIAALLVRVELLERKGERLEESLERARAGLASAVAEMAGLPPQADIPWRSLHGGEPIEAVFVNDGERTVTLVFVGYDGRAHDEVTIVAGGEHRVSTHTGHLWRLRDDEEVVWQGYVRAGQARLGATALR